MQNLQKQQIKAVSKEVWLWMGMPILRLREKKALVALYSFESIHHKVPQIL
jgi:hypothetical protein